jgi:type III restriction enzyme
VAKPFFERPILKSPHTTPARHHPLDADGQPLDLPPIEGRLGPRYVAPVPPPQKLKSKRIRATLALSAPSGLSTGEQAYNPSPIINEIQSHVRSWRGLRNPADWGANACRPAPSPALAPPRIQGTVHVLPPTKSGRDRDLAA